MNDTNPNERFAGKMSEEYRLVEKAYPHFEILQNAVGSAIAGFETIEEPVRVIELGCGDGITAEVILRSQPGIHLVALDNEAKMVERARENLASWISQGAVEVIEADALAYLQQASEDSFHIAAGALTLHNLQNTYRSVVLGELFRALKPGGLFVNADKYAPEGQERFDALVTQLGRFFDAFLPAGKYELLQDWVLHNVADQAPDRVMTEKDARREMSALGFVNIEVSERHNMEAVLTARKPG